MEERKIFEDYPTVDCNDCTNYWNDQCDGVTHIARDCKHYRATRKVFIPKRIEELEESLKVTKLYTTIMFILLISAMLFLEFGG